MKLGTEVGLGPGHTVLHGDTIPSPKKAQPPIFGHVRCGQTARWIKMPLGMEMGLGAGYIVLDGDPTPPSERGAPFPLFGPCLLCPNS